MSRTENAFWRAFSLTWEVWLTARLGAESASTGICILGTKSGTHCSPHKLLPRTKRKQTGLQVAMENG